MKYCVDKPYPTPRVLGKNEHYADILSAAYAGKISEQTAIHQYLYQNLSQNLEEYREPLEKIAIVEMHHFDLLGRTIFLLGKDPIYAATGTDLEPIFWTATYVPYTTDLEELLELDIESEREAIRDYRIIIREIKDPYIIELIERIIEDEELHLKIFHELLDQYNQSNKKSDA